MKVLTRRVGETIVVNDDIVIKVVDIHGKQIRIGIDVPSGMTVSRGEDYEREKYSMAVIDITVSRNISPRNLGRLLSALDRLHTNLVGKPLEIESIKITTPDSINDYENLVPSEIEE